MSRRLALDKKTDRKSDKPTTQQFTTQSSSGDFGSRFSQLIRVFQSEIPEGGLMALADQCALVAEAWESQPQEVQSAYQTETVLQGLTQHLFSEELPVPIRLRLIRSCLCILVRLNISAVAERLESYDNVIGPKQTLVNCRIVLETLVKISQQTANDKAVTESAVLKYAFIMLSSLAAYVESNNAKKDRRSLFERKGSLKKIEETKDTAILANERPRSKGRTPMPLNSFSKRDSKTLITQPVLVKEERTDIVQDIVLLLLNFVKNCSANVDLRRKILQEQCLTVLHRYLMVWDEKNITAIGTKMLVQITAAHRHLAADDKSSKAFLKSECFEGWTRLIELFPRSNDIVLNILRLFSKLSTLEECCQRIHAKKICIRNLVSFFREYRSNIYIVIRVAFIFANMTSFLMDIRNEIYFEFGAFGDVYACFEHYTRSELQGKSEIDKMGLTMTAWDYQTMKKQSDVEALVKIIRLLANLFTVNEIGQDIYLNRGNHFKDLIKKLKELLEKKCSIVQHADLIVCSLSCMANALFYDRQVLMSNMEYRTTKSQLVPLLGNFIVQVDNEQICCEGLRVLSNLSRTREFIRLIVDAKLHEATFILLESSSKEIVYYSLGVLINLLTEAEFKAKYKLDIVCAVLEILKECSQEDFDIVAIGLRCLGSVVEGGTENLDGQLLKDVEQALQRLGGQCDLLMVSESLTKKPNTPGSKQDNLQESRNLINLILNNLPEQSFVCPVKSNVSGYLDCGRKFGDEKKLKDHIDRRHKLS